MVYRDFRYCRRPPGHGAELCAAEPDKHRLARDLCTHHLLGSLVFCCVPFIIYANRKPWWRDKGSSFYPFNWQIEGRHPSQVSKWAPGYQPTEQEVTDAINGDIEALLSPKASVEAMAKAAELADKEADRAAQDAEYAKEAADAAVKAAQEAENSVLESIDSKTDNDSQPTK